MKGNQEDKNKALVEKIDLAFSTGEMGFILSHMHDDVVWEMVGDAPFEGKKEVERIMKKMEEMPPPELSMTKITAEGENVVAEGLIKSTTNEGKPFNAAYCDSYLIQDGKIKEMKSYVVELKTEVV